MLSVSLLVLGLVASVGEEGEGRQDQEEPSPLDGSLPPIQVPNSLLITCAITGAHYACSSMIIAEEKISSMPRATVELYQAPK